MFYVIDKEDKLSIFDDNKEKIEKTRGLMPQLEGQYTLETDIVTADELRAHPNKVLVDDIEIEIEVPDFKIVDIEVEIHDTDEDGNYIYDEEGNPVTHTETRPVQEPVMLEYEDTETVIDYDEEGNPTGSHEITVMKHKQSTHKETVTVKGFVINPNYEQEQADRREAEFNKAFFNTSLGYIRRSVTMSDGSKKDFLSDLMPTIKMGLESGIPVNILAYDKPPFNKDVEDWKEYQHQVVVTPQFIQECFMQLSNDFLPINEDE